MKENPRTFWTNVKKHRERSFVTIEMMSELLDITQNDYSNMENRSTQSIPDSVQDKISTILNKPIDELWDYYIEPMPFWDNEKRYRILNKISPDEIAKAMGYAKRTSLYHKETRKTPIKASEATRIADTLGTTLEKLAGIDATSEKIKDMLKNNRRELEAFLELRDNLPRGAYDWLFERGTVDKLIEMYKMSRG